MSKFKSLKKLKAELSKYNFLNYIDHYKHYDPEESSIFITDSQSRFNFYNYFGDFRYHKNKELRWIDITGIDIIYINHVPLSRNDIYNFFDGVTFKIIPTTTPDGGNLYLNEDFSGYNGGFPDIPNNFKNMNWDINIEFLDEYELNQLKNKHKRIPYIQDLKVSSYLIKISSVMADTDSKMDGYNNIEWFKYISEHIKIKGNKVNHILFNFPTIRFKYLLEECTEFVDWLKSFSEPNCLLVLNGYHKPLALLKDFTPLKHFKIMLGRNYITERRHTAHQITGRVEIINSTDKKSALTNFKNIFYCYDNPKVIEILSERLVNYVKHVLTRNILISEIQKHKDDLVYFSKMINDLLDVVENILPEAHRIIYEHIEENEFHLIIKQDLHNDFKETIGI